MATANAASLNLCQNLVVQLDTQPGLPSQILDEVGIVNALLSPDNVAGFEQIKRDVQAQVGDKTLPNTVTPVVQFRYLKPDCTIPDSTCDTAYCTPLTAAGDPFGYVNLTIDKCAQRRFTITQDQFDAVCYDKDMLLAILMKQKGREVVRDMNAKLRTVVEAQMGNYADGTSSLLATKDIPLFNTSGGLNAAGMALFNMEYMDIGVTGGITKVGGSKLKLYNEFLGVAGANTTNGTDATRLAAASFFYDTTLNDAMLTWQNGTIQLFEVYKNAGRRKMLDETYIQDTIMIDGVMFDYYMSKAYCATDGVAWTVTLEKRFGLWSIPTADFTCAVDTGVNNKLKFNISCAAIDCATLGFS